MSKNLQPGGKSQDKEQQEEFDANTNPELSQISEENTTTATRNPNRWYGVREEHVAAQVIKLKDFKVAPSVESGLFGEQKNKLNPLQSFLWALGIKPNNPTE